MGMTEIIKEFSLKEIAAFQERVRQNPVQNVVELTLPMQSRIIINTLVGRGNSQKKIEQEMPDGSIQLVSIYETLITLIEATVSKYQNPVHKHLFEFTPFNYLKDDRRLGRNCARLHTFLQKMADEH